MFKKGNKTVPIFLVKDFLAVLCLCEKACEEERAEAGGAIFK